MAKAPQPKAKAPDEEEQEEAAEGAEQPKRKRLSGKKLVLFIVLPALLLLGGGGAAAYFTGLIGQGTSSAEQQAQAADDKPAFYYEMPEMLVNLASTGKKPSYLKLRLNLELTDSEATKQIEAVLPRIVDSFQVYLRALRVEDLQGSAGLYRLRQELLTRVADAARPAQVRDVLFKEMLVQ